MKKLIPICFFKGATMYEFQIHRLVITWCFLRCGHYKNISQLDRFNIYIVNKEDY